LAFLNKKKSKVALNTLWRICSMLKSTLLTYHNIKLSDYGSLTLFLKQNTVGYKPKITIIFVKEDMDRFFLTVPNNSFLSNIYLFINFNLFIFRLLLFGIVGACRRDELIDLLSSNIEATITYLIVIMTIRETKNYKPKSFALVVLLNSFVKLLEIYQKYIFLKPLNL
jgi:branched-subunit amino acid transport protein AzlD